MPPQPRGARHRPRSPAVPRSACGRGGSPLSGNHKGEYASPPPPSHPPTHPPASSYAPPAAKVARLYQWGVTQAHTGRGVPHLPAHPHLNKVIRPPSHTIGLPPGPPGHGIEVRWPPPPFIQSGRLGNLWKAAILFSLLLKYRVAGWATCGRRPSLAMSSGSVPSSRPASSLTERTSRRGSWVWWNPLIETEVPLSQKVETCIILMLLPPALPLHAGTGRQRCTSQRCTATWRRYTFCAGGPHALPVGGQGRGRGGRVTFNLPCQGAICYRLL